MPLKAQEEEMKEQVMGTNKLWWSYVEGTWKKNFPNGFWGLPSFNPERQPDVKGWIRYIFGGFIYIPLWNLLIVCTQWPMRFLEETCHCGYDRCMQVVQKEEGYFVSWKAFFASTGIFFTGLGRGIFGGVRLALRGFFSPGESWNAAMQYTGWKKVVLGTASAVLTGITWATFGLVVAPFVAAATWIVTLASPAIVVAAKVIRQVFYSMASRVWQWLTGHKQNRIAPTPSAPVVSSPTLIIISAPSGDAQNRQSISKSTGTPNAISQTSQSADSCRPSQSQPVSASVSVSSSNSGVLHPPNPATLVRGESPMPSLPDSTAKSNVASQGVQHIGLNSQTHLSQSAQALSMSSARSTFGIVRSLSAPKKYNVGNEVEENSYYREEESDSARERRGEILDKEFEEALAEAQDELGLRETQRPGVVSPRPRQPSVELFSPFVGEGDKKFDSAPETTGGQEHAAPIPLRRCITTPNPSPP